MALNWSWGLTPWWSEKAARIESNRIIDAKGFLTINQGVYFEIFDPEKNKNIKWKEASRLAILKYWDEKMTRSDKIIFQNMRKATVPAGSATEVIDI